MSTEASGSTSHVQPPSGSSSEAPIDLTGVESSSESEGDSGNEHTSRTREHYDYGFNPLQGLSQASYADDDDEGSEIEITLTDETRAQLHHAIATLSEARLRAVISSLVEADVQIEALLTRELVSVQEGTDEPVPLWATCSHCSEEFGTSTVREEGECVFHPGILEPSEDSAASWDFDANGPLDTVDNRNRYPEYFKWTCCDKDGATSGCVQGTHDTHHSRKRKRVGE